eukprot:9488531-Pyramimonas_sp.AAC.3
MAQVFNDHSPLYDPAALLETFYNTSEGSDQVVCMRESCSGRPFRTRNVPAAPSEGYTVVLDAGITGSRCQLLVDQLIYGGCALHTAGGLGEHYPTYAAMATYNPDMGLFSRIDMQFTLDKGGSMHARLTTQPLRVLPLNPLSTWDAQYSIKSSGFLGGLPIIQVLFIVLWLYIMLSSLYIDTHCRLMHVAALRDEPWGRRFWQGFMSRRDSLTWGIIDLMMNWLQVVALGFLASVYIVMYTEVVNARAFYDFHAASYGTANFFLPARVRTTADHKRDPAMAHASFA